MNIMKREVKQQNQLSYDDKMELNLLELLEFRTSQLCNDIRLHTDIHLSWSDLCSIVCPSNPTRIAEKIYAHFNKVKMINDNIYHEIYQGIYDIGKIENENDKFYNCDVIWISSIAEIIYVNFKDVWKFIIKIMGEIHKDYGGGFDLDFLFREAILTMRERCLIGDDLFTCEYEYKKCKDNGDGEELVKDDLDEIGKAYQDYYGEMEYGCWVEEWDEDGRLGRDRVLH